MVFLLRFICVCAILSFCASKFSQEDYEFQDDKYHPCARKCRDNEPPQTCRYQWILENYYVLSRACFNCPLNQSQCFLPHCVSANGVSRAIKTVNRRLPGPSIQVCEGDTIEVIIDNRLDVSEATTIHWHGVLNRGSPHMDGVALITQCPIPSHSKFKYRYKAANAGTHFWHAHSGLQRSDGLFGALIVRGPPGLDPNYRLYDHDLSEHVVVLTDWLRDAAMTVFTSLYHDSIPKSSTILVNGMESYEEFKSPDGTSAYTPRATFTVEGEYRYRFRVIHAGSTSCHIQVSVDEHALMIIASDGNAVEPVVADSFILVPGERLDFVLHADKTETLQNYWFRFQGEIECKNYTAFALLKYRSTSDVPLPENKTPKATDIALQNLKHHQNPTLFWNMRANSPDDDTMTSRPHRTLYLMVDLGFVNDIRFNNPVYYPLSAFPVKEHIYSPQINHISWMSPQSPPLTQYNYVPKDLFCNAESLDKDCTTEHCMCLHTYRLRLGDIVELVLVNEGKLHLIDHSFHLHGHHFRVLATHRANRTISIEEIKKLDAEGKLMRVGSKAPIKDTVNVPSPGYVVIRFKADNPGFWIFHCHNEIHMVVGMSLLFQVGTLDQMPKAPRNFPTCGDWTGDVSDEERTGNNKTLYS